MPELTGGGHGEHHPFQGHHWDSMRQQFEAGKLGNLIVTDRNPLQIRTQILHVFINGHPVDLSNKHLELYEKYRARR